MEYTNRRPTRLRRQRPPGRASLERNPGRVPLQSTNENSEKQPGNRILNIFKSSKRKNAETLASVLESNGTMYNHNSFRAPKRSSTLPPRPLPGLNHKESKKSIRSRPSDSERPVLRTSTTWDPPPLFQAYPQSIKHGRLQASNLSADHILLLNQRETSLDQGTDGRVESRAGNRESKSKGGKHRRNLSNTISRAEWTEKIYILVTSGYLLQYASDGHHDRLPEKILHLNKDSVAFASDAIPGKHWVLQISRTADDDGALDLKPSKSLKSRLGFHNQESKRSSKSFLLVMNSPEELDMWLATVRREIEALGSGKYFQPEPDETNASHALGHRNSRTLLIKRDPKKFSDATDLQSYSSRPSRSSYYSQDDRETYLQPTGAENRRSVGRMHSDERSVNSGEAAHEPYEGRRHSVISRSSGLTVSRSSIYTSEPSTPTALEIDHSTMPEIKASETKESNSYETQKQRGLTAPSPAGGKLATPSNAGLPGASYGVPNTSPVTPNFSMPSFSKRFSTTAMTLSPQTTRRSQTLPIQALNATTGSSEGTTAKDNRRVSTLGELPDQFRVSKNTTSRVSSPTPHHRVPASSSSPTPSVYPKRLSSLEFAYGKFPAPGPPPSSELPSLPKDTIQTASALRRPMSMQLRPSQTSQPGPRSPTRPLSHYTSASVLNEKSQRSEQDMVLLSKFHPLQKGSVSSAFQSQNIVPGLGASPPMGPPPTGPLPEVPLSEPEPTPRRNSLSADVFRKRRRSTPAVEGKDPLHRTSVGHSRRSIACP